MKSMQFRSAVTPTLRLLCCKIYVHPSSRCKFLPLLCRISCSLDFRAKLKGGERRLEKLVFCNPVFLLSLHRYDLLFGVVRAEAYFVFAAEDIQYGIESERRGKLLKAFVRDTYRWALNNNKHEAAAKYGTLFSSATSPCMRASSQKSHLHPSPCKYERLLSPTQRVCELFIGLAGASRIT